MCPLKYWLKVSAEQPLHYAWRLWIFSVMVTIVLWGFTAKSLTFFTRYSIYEHFANLDNATKIIKQGSLTITHRDGIRRTTSVYDSDKQIGLCWNGCQEHVPGMRAGFHWKDMKAVVDWAPDPFIANSASENIFMTWVTKTEESPLKITDPNKERRSQHWYYRDTSQNTA